ncbi:GGDEF domain-containing protein [Oceanispirochaeta crateris]|uniref:GGDEF domain-containing protein n=1 Tax=Oceanispirochaeta crateris TaxID=2518645 RepID=A0A5C1QKH6_9SPIO|nr:bifunctional diguanylate cyclase/phosphodiesterase [Oceanispirochaeta crateris]QEN07520.1 GGDEF domain-containing protein [Oceanispirochaeta crateris]
MQKKDADQKIKKLETLSTGELVTLVTTLEEERESLISQVGELAIEYKNIQQQNSDLKRRVVLNHKTGLQNHVKANEDINRLLDKRFERDDMSPIAFILVKLNENFEAINKALKPSISEWVLYQIGVRLTELSGPENTVYHTREDEFLIVYESMTDESRLHMFLQLLNEELKRPHIFSGYNISIDSSCGISLFPKHGLERNALLHNSDIALSYAFKQHLTYTIFTDEISNLVIQKMELQNSIIKALEKQAIKEINKQFYLNYQPILTIEINSDSFTVIDVKAESLIRWNHPEKGGIKPDDFIPLAEETGLIIPLGNWVLFSAARQLQNWHNKNCHDVQISVNVSPRQFYDSELVDTFKRMVETYDIDPSDLKIELTENSLIDNPVNAIKKLNQLREAGFHISLDDFGTGYSSLNYLKDLPVDTVKIDKSFINKIDNNQLDQSILKGILYFIRELNYDLIVEGVETLEQLKSLVEMGCRSFQGYFFSSALSESDFIKYRKKILGKKFNITTWNLP